MHGRRAAEVDTSELTTVAARPAAMVPWSNDEKVLFSGVVTFEQLVDLDWTIEVFLVPPTGDVECRHGDAIEPRRERLAFPKRGVVGFVDEGGPGGDLALEVFLIRIREWTEFQIPLVGVKLVDDLRDVGDLFA